MFDATGPLDKVQKAAGELLGGSIRSMTLKLVCQYTMEPVGAGYKIQAPREFVPKLLPALEFGLKAMHKVKDASSLLQTFGIPLPKPPQELIELTSGLIDGLAGRNGYACIDAAAKAAAPGGNDEATALARHQQHEFAAFLEKHDPEVSQTSRTA